LAYANADRLDQARRYRAGDGEQNAKMMISAAAVICKANDGADQKAAIAVVRRSLGPTLKSKI
jgi:hypothetical protein